MQANRGGVQSAALPSFFKRLAPIYLELFPSRRGGGGWGWKERGAAAHPKASRARSLARSPATGAALVALNKRASNEQTQNLFNLLSW